MSSSCLKNNNLVLKELSQVIDATQFSNGVIENPEVNFGAIKEQTRNHMSLSTATLVLQLVKYELSEKISELSKATAELDLAQQKVRKLEKKVSSSSTYGSFLIEEYLDKFTDVFGD